MGGCETSSLAAAASVRGLFSLRCGAWTLLAGGPPCVCPSWSGRHIKEVLSHAYASSLSRQLIPSIYNSVHSHLDLSFQAKEPASYLSNKKPTLPTIKPNTLTNTHQRPPSCLLPSPASSSPWPRPRPLPTRALRPAAPLSQPATTPPRSSSRRSSSSRRRGDHPAPAAPATRCSSWGPSTGASTSTTTSSTTTRRLSCHRWAPDLYYASTLCVFSHDLIQRPSQKRATTKKKKRWTTADMSAAAQ